MIFPSHSYDYDFEHWKAFLLLHTIGIIHYAWCCISVLCFLEDKTNSFFSPTLILQLNFLERLAFVQNSKRWQLCSVLRLYKFCQSLQCCHPFTTTTHKFIYFSNLPPLKLIILSSIKPPHVNPFDQLSRSSTVQSNTFLHLYVQYLC